MQKTDKIYLMIAGTMFPAFLLTFAHISYHKRATLKISDLLIFALASGVAGYFSSQMLKEPKT